ncbi:MAG TPA: hypothetical protein VHC98_00900 [Candidatus Saccharimonadales bacterium]|nr:hypothetical protein [Candidatus Saccharimonadales bacterium]
MYRRILAAGIVIAGCCCLIVASASADEPLRSAHFQIDESVVGGSGLTQESSPNYQAGEVIGDIGIGNSASSGYQVSAGYDTTGNPALTFVVDGADTSFGGFSPSAAATATATFTVIDYTSYGYVIQVVGDPPSNGSHTISAMATTGASVPGTEQFGMNVVKNTNFCGSGCDVGANPDYGQFGATSAGPTANYDTPNMFRYVSGETIVQSPKSSGAITYTISYIINVTSLTPGGHYGSNQFLICTGTY